MSAITGIFHFDGQLVDILLPERMNQTLIHRGPDSSGIWLERNVAFGHRMLHTTPESIIEKLPLMNNSGDLVITSDARLDNREELLTLLGLSVADFAAVADSQLILAAYEMWGESCVEKLLGDFAFVIWDRRRQTVFCARDPIGVKPFYYYLSERSFVFASEIKAILSLPEIPCRLNEAKVADHLLNAFEDKSGTFYEGILRLPPAHCLSVGEGKAKLHCYWSFDPSREIRLGSNLEYAEAFRELFTSAVRCRLRRAFPIGSSLSGGLDSSSIACTGRKLLDEEQTFHTFSAIFPGLPKEDLSKIDEQKYVKAVLALGGFDPHFIRADRLSPLTDLKESLWHQDETFLAPNLYMHQALYKEAQCTGVRIFLDGLDGDSTVSHGLDYLGELTRRGRFIKLYSEASALSRRSPNQSFTPRSILWHYGLRPLVPNKAVALWRAMRRRRLPNENGIFSRPFIERFELARISAEKTSERLSVRESHIAGLNSGQIPYTLELADKASSAFGIETRYPFFDRRLMEFCVAIPPEQKLSEGWTRVVMRRAMEGILPEQVQWRIGKANLSPNFKRKLIECDKPIIDSVIEREPQILEKYFDLPALRAAYGRYASQPMAKYQEALAVYSAVMLGFWLKDAPFDRLSDVNIVSNRIDGHEMNFRSSKVLS